MASIENAAASPESLAQWRDSLKSMSRSELLTQQLVQRGAEHALENLQKIGITPENCSAMLAGVQEGLMEIHAAAIARGFGFLDYEAPQEGQ